MPENAQYGSIQFQEKIDFFRDKLRLPTATWADIWQQQHAKAFVVAGAMKDDLLADFQAAIAKGIAGESTLEDFRKDFDAIVKKHGWSYNGGRNWRTRVIYDTNLRTAYASGRYQQMQQLKRSRPYWQYKHSIAVTDAREEHLAWDGMVLSADDPWWDVHYPPNGWGCQCYVRTLSERDLQRKGLTVSEAPQTVWSEQTVGVRTNPRTVKIAEGVDAGFAYNPGKAALKGITPEFVEFNSISTAICTFYCHGPDDLPSARKLPKEMVMEKGLPFENYMAAFLAEFNASIDDPKFFKDVTGHHILINEFLFQTRDKEWKHPDKLEKRLPYIKLMAETLKDPDEIWLQWKRVGSPKLGQTVLVRRYIANIQLEDARGGFAVFDLSGKYWSGVTIFTPDSGGAYLEQQRNGERIYQRK